MIINLHKLVLNVILNMDHHQILLFNIMLYILQFNFHIIKHLFIKLIMHSMANIYTMVNQHLNEILNNQYL